MISIFILISTLILIFLSVLISILLLLFRIGYSLLVLQETTLVLAMCTTLVAALTTEASLLVLAMVAQRAGSRTYGGVTMGKPIAKAQEGIIARATQLI